MNFNTNQLSISVTLGNGHQMNMIVEPYEAIIDANGYVRMFSMVFDNGDIGNFKLLPNNQTKSRILNFCADFLTPIGLDLVGRQVINHENKIVTNVGRYMFKHFTTPIVQDFFRSYDIQDSSYYALDTGERVITHPVKLRRL